MPAPLLDSPPLPLAVAAQRLGISWAAAHKLVLTGKLKGQFINGRWHVEEDSLNVLLGQMQQLPASVH